ncbi:MAG: glycoside hydrolase family 32 protein, partial [Anaeroplasmataceae bacterium]|nr:glycoside hydrolase family 32 protein [Anaeroplasmataceae bacterium]
MKSLSEIDNFVEVQKKKVNDKYRLKYHMMPPVGWMNDPNGLIYFGCKYHLFYQYNPYNTLPGTMVWGPSTSKDLIRFKDEPIAIVPTEEHTSIFSGGAIEINGELNAIYTLHYEHDGLKKEEVYLSKSKDGIHFSNPVCVFDNDVLPENISRMDFRDPFPVQIDDTYYVLLGGKDIKLNKGVIVVLKGNTLDKLEYAFTLGPFYELGDMGECPSYYKVDNKDVIIVSGCHVQNRENDFRNINSSIFIVGELDFKQGKMAIDFIKEIDKGDAFYAPQFINGSNEPVMIGWMEMWGKEYPTHEMNHNWTGAFSIPRKLLIKDNDIYQMPVDNIKSYHKAYCSNTHCLDICFDIFYKGKFEINGTNGKVVLSLEDYFYLDTTQANNKNGYIRRTNHTY